MNRGIPQDRDCLTAVPTGGVETSKQDCVFSRYLAQERALSSSEMVLCDKREKRVSCCLTKGTGVSEIFSQKHILCDFAKDCLCLAIVGQIVELSYPLSIWVTAE